jgi:hypothetical protein
VGSSEYVCKVVWARSGDYKVCDQGGWYIGCGQGRGHRLWALVSMCARWYGLGVVTIRFVIKGVVHRLWARAWYIGCGLCAVKKVHRRAQGRDMGSGSGDYKVCNQERWWQGCVQGCSDRCVLEWSRA